MTDDFETEIGRPREFLAPCLLLLLAESPGHGYELMERLKPLGFDWNGPGPIYRELRSLEAAGLVRSSWFVGQAGPGRRVYEITPSGRKFLDRSIAAVAGLQGLIDEYLARFRALTARSPVSSPAAPPPQAQPVSPHRTRPFRRVHASRDGEQS